MWTEQDGHATLHPAAPPTEVKDHTTHAAAASRIFLRRRTTARKFAALPENRDVTLPACRTSPDTSLIACRTRAPFPLREGCEAVNGLELAARFGS